VEWSYHPDEESECATVQRTLHEFSLASFNVSFGTVVIFDPLSRYETQRFILPHCPDHIPLTIFRSLSILYSSYHKITFLAEVGFS
jgi:hypothetical protein